MTHRPKITPDPKPLQRLLSMDDLPQALLLVGYGENMMNTYTDRIIAKALCQKNPSPCGQCRACHLLRQEGHPDRVRIAPIGDTIKIDQIRELHNRIYHRPQQGLQRIVMIASADHMTLAASHALLKILEEPPGSVIFLLTAEQIGSIPVTILSRCQRTIIIPEVQDGPYRNISLLYSAEEPRGQLYEAYPVMLQGIIDLLDERSSPCALAEQWSTYALHDLLWLLYLITADAIRDQLHSSSEHHPPSPLAHRLTTITLFKQLDALHAMIQKIRHTQGINLIQGLEMVFLGYRS